ncbi:inactive anthranilate O-methyltransferase 1-like [Triticum dicoccoides]|uniref:inactive anthranilate O-methyltransferase 1-like n=1 Tax=Triticum dicoccoides TaxID=85692 RepID=UPI0018907DC8|nr:inactive anthranilate O-methyltransferase 1-like [Triticum dicoccoides]XP_037418428.1 inactive anthranilate O-methyltransferase 1-like [Triticum dicoccoides]
MASKQMLHMNQGQWETSYARNSFVQAPEDLLRNLIPVYDIDEEARYQRHPIVLEAYAERFTKDFTLFPELRAKELVAGGRMVVSLVGRRSDVTVTKFSYLSRTISHILSVMVSEGVVDKEKFGSFYVPVYEPSIKEVREVIQEEGSFFIREIHVHDPTTDMNNALSAPCRFVNLLRALCEPILV